MKIAKKNIKKIQTRLSEILDLSNTEEFETSFENEPSYWSEHEAALCDYSARIKNEIMLMLGEVLGFSLDDGGGE